MKLKINDVDVEIENIMITVKSDNAEELDNMTERLIETVIDKEGYLDWMTGINVKYNFLEKDDKQTFNRKLRFNDRETF